MGDLLARATSDMGLFMEVAGTLAISVVLTVLAIVELRRAKPAATVLFGMGILMGVFSGVLWGTMNDRGSRWRWILATLPALILIAHAAFLYYVRSRVVPPASPGNMKRGKEMLSALSRVSDTDADAAIQSALQSGERYFSIEALMLRYFVPALFVFGLTLGISNQLSKWSVLYGLDGHDCRAAAQSALCKLLTAATDAQHGYVKAGEVVFLPAASVIGAACGLVGAYVYVLLYLGRRAFRLDITPGAAVWCAVTMAVGPTLAAFLGPYVLGSNPWQNATELQRASVLFFAGFSPRLIVTLLNELMLRLFGERPGKAQNRGLPLSQVSGITRDLEERLSEEGIDDASQLAMADPYRLLRNTSYDKRQILRWIDTALLAVSLPESFPALERRGVSGAMSLVWYAQDASRQQALKQLAKDAKIDESVLADLAARLATDAQVMLVRLLYELDDRSAAGTGAA